MRSFWFKMLAVTMAVCATLICTEIILQFVDFPKQTWSPWVADNHTGYRYGTHLDQQMMTEEYNVHIATNQQGLRDDPVGEKKKFRILMLGDSFTFGYGVERHQIFADLLEKEMDIEIVNAGTGGFDLIHQIQFVQHYAQSFQPDLMVYMLFLGNDLTENEDWIKEGENLKGYNRPTVRSHQDIKLISLLKILRHRLRYLNHHRREWVLPPQYLEMTAKTLSPKAVERYQKDELLFAELVHQSSAIKVPLVVCSIPYKTMVEQDSAERFAQKTPHFFKEYDLAIPRKIVESWARMRRIPYIDLTEDLKQHYQENRRQLFFYKDGHLNPYGHAVVAGILKGFLEGFLSPEKTVTPIQNS